ncbi:hypothetical protein FRC09_007099 [Ceratobasidium sp. 395]|nr:hypothetical protein FRC09_007099 [Ceratobasidium sp. 395]
MSESASSSSGFRVSSAVKATSLPPGTESKPLINLSQGVPGSQPHVLVAQRLSEVVKDGKSAAYGGIFGDEDMRKALAEEMKYVYGGKEGGTVDVMVEDVALAAGCNAAFMAAVMAIAERGDEVIPPTPWYFNNQMTLQMLGIGIIPLPVSIEDGFIPKVEVAESLITPRTRALVLVSPNNPTGVIYSPSLLRSFSDLTSRHNIALILDETYRDFVAPGPPHDLFVHGNWRSNLVHLFSFSKSYRVPGHRLGAIVGGKVVLENVYKVLDSRPLQITLAPLLPSLRSDLADQSAELSTRHDIFRQTLLQHPSSGWQIGSAGAYFALVKHPFKGVHATEVCRRLAEECGVVLLPLSFFAPSHDSAWDAWIRVSVANVGPDALRDAAVRLRESGKLLNWEIA